MPLLALYKADPAAVNEFTIEQVVGSAGNGDLKDGSKCSEEFRAFLSQVSTKKLAGYVERCLSAGFPKSGMALQDLTNELGRRLDYSVENGRYQGTTNAIGFDGLWSSPEGQHSIVIEVKTTDAYRLSLDKVAEYREKLRENTKIGAQSSILIVVGRDDTGELEAQVRGSRHAWDIRLISTEALLKLVDLKENAEEPETGRKIRSLLIPREYTRLDEMIDVMFTTAHDVVGDGSTAEGVIEDEDLTTATTDEDAKHPKGVWQFTDSAVLQKKREDIVASVGRKIGKPLIKKSRALFWSPTHDARIACAVSKRYTKKNAYPYWYAYHPEWDEFLREGQEAFFVLGCMDLQFAFCIPWNVLSPLLESMNTTTTEKHTYWHVHIIEAAGEEYSLLLPKAGKNKPLAEFKMAI